jgi:glycosyltransferase involved in cell wall biosynthesis
MSSPKVSIIIPTYNRAHLIGLTLESALRQTFSDYEIVVIDDGSKDNTADVVRSIAPQARYIWQENVGIPEVLNVCVREARGEYISFLGSDDALAPTALEKEAAILDANPAVGLVHSAAWLMDEAGRLTQLLKPPFTRAGYVRSGREEIGDLLMSNHIVATTVMVRRRCFDECGFFDRRFGLYEDWNMWTRIFKRWDAGYVNEPLAFYRVHGGEAGSIFRKAAPRDLACYRRMQLDEVLADPEIGASFRHLRRRAFARHYYAVALQAFDSGDRAYGRLNALRSVAANAFGTTGRAAAWLLAKNLAPGFALNAARRLMHAGDSNVSPARANSLTIDAILHGAGVPEA